jgi:hypothetical protein
MFEEGWLVGTVFYLQYGICSILDSRLYWPSYKAYLPWAPSRVGLSSWAWLRSGGGLMERYTAPVYIGLAKLLIMFDMARFV